MSKNDREMIAILIGVGLFILFWISYAILDIAARWRLAFGEF